MNVAAISYDPVRILADFAARRGITFPLLSDAGSATIKRYGILNTTIDPKNELYGYPFPGTFIVDRNGVVTSRVFEPITRSAARSRAFSSASGSRLTRRQQRFPARICR